MDKLENKLREIKKENKKLIRNCEHLRDEVDYLNDDYYLLEEKCEELTQKYEDLEAQPTLRAFYEWYKVDEFSSFEEAYQYYIGMHDCI